MRRCIVGAGLALLAVCSTGNAADPRYNYVLHCVGCHTFEGVSPPLGRIPPLKGVVGHFARSQAARRYIANVPGIKNSGLSPDDTAALINWLIEVYGEESRPETWTPFTGDEIVAWRKDVPDNVMDLRRTARVDLEFMGFDIGRYP